MAKASYEPAKQFDDFLPQPKKYDRAGIALVAAGATILTLCAATYAYLSNTTSSDPQKVEKPAENNGENPL